MTRSLRARLAAEDGAEAVSFVLLAPILLLFFEMILVGGRLATIQADVASAAREAARQASMAAGPATAGVDIHADDELGYFNVSSQGLYQRDWLVLSRCLAAEIPVAAVIGGGYQRDLQKVVALHRLLFKAAADIAP